MTSAEQVQQETFGWWFDQLTPQDRASAAVKCQRMICELPGETYRRDRDLFNIRLYENNPVITLYNFAGAYYSEAPTMSLPVPEQSTNNKAKAAIDTLAAQIASTNQRARFMVVDGDYRQRRRARELQTFTDGLVLELKLHALRQRAFLDAAILESGVGAITFYRKDGRCAAERALATEFSVSPSDGMINGQPRTLYRRRPISRDALRADFKGDEAALEAINAAPRVKTGDPSDQVEVFEATHLRSGADADDGWRVMAVDVAVNGGLLAAEEYKKDHHETVFFAIEGRFTTGWGLSLMTQARKLQCRINANEYRSERTTKLFSGGHLYLNKAAQISTPQITNENGSIWKGNGPAAEALAVIQFNGMTADIDAKIVRDGQLIFENLGISIAAAQAETNSGLNESGAAKREEVAKSDQRNAVRQQRWEQFHLDCVHVALGIVRDCVTQTSEGKDRKKTAKSYKVATPGRRGLTVTDWKDVAIDEQDYVLEIKPANPIPTEPSGLVAFGEKMIQLAAWKPERLAGYLQDLDAEGRTNRQMSQERQLEKVFEAMLYDKVAAAMPDEFTNLGLALEIGTEYLSQGMEDGVPEKHLERVRRYLKKCKALGKAAADAAQAAQAPPAAAAGTPVPGGVPIPGTANGPAAIAA